MASDRCVKVKTADHYERARFPLFGAQHVAAF